MDQSVKARGPSPVALVVAALLAMTIAFVGCGGDDGGDLSDAGTDTGNPPNEDVTLDACEARELQGTVASGVVSNSSSSSYKASYQIEVDFLDAAGNLVTNGWTVVDDLPAGGDAPWETGAFGAPSDAPIVDCTITNVSRHFPDQAGDAIEGGNGDS